MRRLEHLLLALGLLNLCLGYLHCFLDARQSDACKMLLTGRSAAYGRTGPKERDRDSEQTVQGLSFPLTIKDRVC